MDMCRGKAKVYAAAKKTRKATLILGAGTTPRKGGCAAAAPLILSDGGDPR